MKLLKSKLEWMINPNRTHGYELRLAEARGKLPDLNKLESGTRVLILEEPDTHMIELEELERTHLLGLMNKYREITFLFLTDLPVQFVGRVFPRNVWLGFIMHCQRDIQRLSSLTRQESNKFLVIDPAEEEIRIRYGTIKWIILGHNEGRPMKKPWVDNFVEDIARYNVSLFVTSSINYKRYPKQIPWIGDISRESI